jgi:hypothetical protein
MPVNGFPRLATLMFAFDQRQNAAVGFPLAIYDLSGQTTLIDSIAASAVGALSR